jgi:hypothetical protein
MPGAMQEIKNQEYPLESEPILSKRHRNSRRMFLKNPFERCVTRRKIPDSPGIQPASFEKCIFEKILDFSFWVLYRIKKWAVSSVG